MSIEESANQETAQNQVEISDPQAQRPSASPVLKKEDTITAPTSSRSTPAPINPLQFQIPPNVDLKPSEIIGGAPVRRWLNEHVTPSLLKGMRLIAQEQPQDPLRVLGEFLIEQSRQAKGAETETTE